MPALWPDELLLRMWDLPGVLLEMSDRAVRRM